MGAGMLYVLAMAVSQQCETLEGASQSWLIAQGLIARFSMQGA